VKNIIDLTKKIFALQDQIAPLETELSRLQSDLIEMASSSEPGTIDDETRRIMREALKLAPRS
jgi:hypothetical protein